MQIWKLISCKLLWNSFPSCFLILMFFSSKSLLATSNFKCTFLELSHAISLSFSLWGVQRPCQWTSNFLWPTSWYLQHQKYCPYISFMLKGKTWKVVIWKNKSCKARSHFYYSSATLIHIYTDVFKCYDIPFFSFIKQLIAKNK